MIKSNRRFVLAVAATALVGLGGTVYAASGPGQHGGMSFMRGMMFWSMDRNDDGFVDRSEFDKFRTKMFERMDADGDGQLSEQEMKNRHGGGYGGHHQRRDHRGQRHGGGRHNGGMMFWFLDRNTDGFVDRAEIDAYRTKRFEKLDSDGDGRITQDDMRNRMGQHGQGPRHDNSRHSGQRHQGGGDHSWRGQRLIERADANDDGAATLEEFLATEPRMFARADTNSDGKISEAEAKEARRPRGERRFKRADANSDGMITLEEFLAVEPRMFSRADKDGDGKISEPEAQEMRGQMRGRRHGDDSEGAESE